MPSPRLDFVRRRAVVGKARCAPSAKLLAETIRAVRAAGRAHQERQVVAWRSGDDLLQLGPDWQLQGPTRLLPCDMQNAVANVLRP
jgi:hypothetical protein